MGPKERADECVVNGLLKDGGGWTGSAASAIAIEQAIEAAIQEEREACANIVQLFASRTFIYQEAADLIIETIRKRSQPTGDSAS